MDAVHVLIVLGFVLVVGRLFQVQVLQHEAWVRAVHDYVWASVTKPAHRGSIYDRSGIELAVDQVSYSIGIDPKVIRTQGTDLAAVAMSTGLDLGVLRRRAAANTRYEYVARDVSEETAKRVREAAKVHAGLNVEEKATRLYPQHSLAAALIGVAGADRVGLSGIERSMNRPLAGVAGRSRVGLDPKGQPIPGTEEVITPVVHGDSLWLTLDAGIQAACERELAKCMKQHHAQRATALVIAPQTGAIVAAASLPGFDPNCIRPGEVSRMTMLFSQFVFEPGSTMKPLVLAEAIDRGIIGPSEVFRCRGAERVGPDEIHCDHPPRGGHGAVDAQAILRVSCNLGAMHVGLRMKNDRMIQALRAFGLLSPTGVEVDEQVGSTPRRETLWPSWCGTAAFGQSVAVTPLGLAMGYACLANDGQLMRPHLVAKRVTPRGEVITTEPEAIGQVVKPSTARSIVQMLKAVVHDPRGTGGAAKVPGYVVAGKTGTAEKAENGRFSKSRFVASFAGLLPADKPQYVILVVVDEPTPTAHYGGVVAAPTFSAIAQAIIEQDGLPSSSSAPGADPRAVLPAR
ncbi:MAG TPA: penicillin-binding protein 2 [Armatimonadota bacterium]|nr:penicillin-binding protein 2 [Armatimonadota bacterium]